MRRFLTAAAVAAATVGWVATWTATASATFPGRNGLIVFDTSDSGSSQIYTVRPDGSGLRQLTHAPADHSAFDPHWSADGRQIAYVDDVSGQPQVWVMRWDGTGQHAVTRGTGFDSFAPSWSPDGARLVMSRCSQAFGTCGIVTVKTDGSGLRTLVKGGWHAGQPVWSPDGRWLAYTSDRGGFDSRLWLARADGGVAHPIAPAKLVADRPSWSPDSRQITFTGDPVNGRLFAIRPNGTGLRALPTGGAAIFGSWSPNYHHMVLLSFLTGSPVLTVADAGGGQRRPIATLPGMAHSDWAVAR